ncbi:MAG: alpha/beta hydrolase, partial [Candidatus Nanoarchaeia archaeon]
MANIVLIREKGFDQKDAWYAWLEKELNKRENKLFIPDFPDSENVEEWIPVVKEIFKFLDSDSMIIGHGFGAKVALKILEQKSRTVAAVFLVAGSLGEEQYDFENIKTKANEFFVYASDNDSVVSAEETEHLASMVGETILLIPEAGHFDKIHDFEDILI